MQVNRILDVQDGDALGTLRGFLAEWWNSYQPEAMLAPVEQVEKSTVIVQVIEDPADLGRVNPFVPIMLSNSAGQANQLVQEHPGARLAAMLRPCELRTYTELRKREQNLRSRREQTSPSQPADEDHMVVFGVDCLGTYPIGELRRNVYQQDLDRITRDTLHNAASGGFQTLHIRTACQVCDWPAPWGADVSVGTIGVDTEKYLLILARSEQRDQELELDKLAGRTATEYQVSRRETVVGAIADAHAGMRRNMMTNAPGHMRFDDLGSMLAWFASCSLCGNCLKACPLYRGELDSLAGLADVDSAGQPSLAELVQASRWLATCSGCGMCEEKCGRDVPLTLFISALSHRIREEAHYIAGSPSQQYPWAGQ